MRTTRLTKVVNRHVQRGVDYATSDGVVALLREHSKKRDLPLFRMLEILAEGKVTSVSFTRASPYFRFYASATTNGDKLAIITINTDEGEYETTLDLSQLADEE